MSRSFLVTSKQTVALTIRNFHVNVWFLNQGSIYLDIGLLLNIDKQRFKHEEILLQIHSPFDFQQGSLENLHDVMLKVEVLHLLFNDEVRDQRPLTYGTDNRAFYVDFRSGRNFLLLKPEIHSGNKPNAFDVRITFDGIRKDDLDLILEEKAILPCYLRFRYKVAIKHTDNIHFERGVIRNDIMYDFRFNELRAFDSKDIRLHDEMARIEDIYIFVIHPYIYRLSLNASAKMKYIRLLEKERIGWGEYLPALTKNNNKFLIYYWRENRSAEDSISSFNLLVSFEAEDRGILRTLFAALLLTPTSFILLALPQYIRLEDITAHLAPLVTAIVRAIGGLGLLVVIGMLPNALWDLVKVGFQRIRGING